MDDIDALRSHDGPNDAGAAQADGKTFALEIGDETFNFRRKRIADRKIVGAQVVAAAGKHPVEDYLVLQHLNSREIESVRPTETVDLVAKGVERFFVIEGSVTFRFTVEGLSMEWPRPSLLAQHVKFLAGAGEDQVLVLDRDDGDVVFDDNELVSLDGSGVERFKLRKAPKTVTVLYKEEPFQLEPRKYTTEELLGVFPVPPGYRLDLIQSDGEFRELKPGEKIKIREGLEFSSHPPCGHSS